MDATRELFERGGVEEANIQAIAKLAGVTRPTVYQQFGSLNELLLAVLNETLDQADVRTVRKALQHPDPVEAMRGMIRGSCRFWAGGEPLFGRIKGLALTDPAAAHVDRLKEQVRRGHVENLSGRLLNENALRPGLKQRDAADRLYFLTSYEAFNDLRRAGYGIDRAAAHLVEMAERTVLA